MGLIGREEKFGRGFAIHSEKQILLFLTGYSEERGMQYGYLAKDWILGCVKGIRDDFQLSFGVLGKNEAVCRFISRLLGWMYFFFMPREIRREIVGIMKGLRLAGVHSLTYSDLWLVNAWPDAEVWLRLFARNFYQRVAMAFQPHCNSFATWGKMSSCGLIFAQNVDYRLETNLLPIFCLHRDEGNCSMAGIRIPGSTGFLTAVSDRGVAYGAVGRLTYPYTPSLGFATIGRRAIEQNKIPPQDAVRSSGYGQHYFFADANAPHTVNVVESSPLRAFVLPQPNEPGFAFKTERAATREARRDQIRSAVKSSWRKDISYTRRRDKQLKKAITTACKEKPMDLDSAKKVLNRTALMDSFGQAIYQIEKGLASFRNCYHGTPARHREWVELDLQKYWVRGRQVSHGQRVELRFEKYGHLKDDKNYKVSIDGGPWLFFTLASGESWSVCPLSSERELRWELRDALSSDLIAVG